MSLVVCWGGRNFPLSFYPIILCLATQSRLTLYNPTDCSLSGSSVRGISQATIMEWVAISSSRGSSWSKDEIHISCVSPIAGDFFTAEPSGEALDYSGWSKN